MSVKKRKDGRWRVDVCVKIDGRRVRERGAAKNRSQALELEREMRTRLQRGVERTKPLLYAEWAKEFMATYVEVNNKHSERRTKKQIMEQHLVPFFGRMPLDRIGVSEVERFKAAQLGFGVSEKGKPRRPAARKTVNNRLTVLRKSLSVAVDFGRLNAIPKVQWLKTAPSKFRFFTFDEASRLLEGAAPGWRTMMLFALRTGLRQGELLALRWEDVDLQRSKLHVQTAIWRGVEGPPKGGRARVVPLSAEAAEALKGLPSRFKKGRVFGDGPKPLTAGLCKWPLWSACSAVGLERCGWHALRHTFASHLVMRGVPLKAVQELLGHTTIAVTMRYAHLAPEVKEDAVARLDSTYQAASS